MTATYRPIGGSGSACGTCPDTCPFLQRAQVSSDGTLAVSRNSGECYGLGYLCHKAQLRSMNRSDEVLPSAKATHVRINVTGDLMVPGSGTKVDTQYIDSLKALARKHKAHVWYGYTHSRDACVYANEGAPKNLVIRLSAHTQDDVDWCKQHGYAYVYVSESQPDGTVQCPNDKNPDVSCVKCKLCANKRKAIWLRLR